MMLLMAVPCSLHCPGRHRQGQTASQLCCHTLKDIGHASSCLGRCLNKQHVLAAQQRQQHTHTQVTNYVPQAACSNMLVVTDAPTLSSHCLCSGPRISQECPALSDWQDMHPSSPVCKSARLILRDLQWQQQQPCRTQSQPSQSQKHLRYPQTRRPAEKANRTCKATQGSPSCCEQTMGRQHYARHSQARPTCRCSARSVLLPTRTITAGVGAGDRDG